MTPCSNRPDRHTQLAAGAESARRAANGWHPIHTSSTIVPLRDTAARAAPLHPARSSSPATTPVTTPQATSRVLPLCHPSATTAGPPLTGPPGQPFAVAQPRPQARRPVFAGRRLRAPAAGGTEGRIRLSGAAYRGSLARPSPAVPARGSCRLRRIAFGGRR